LPSLYRAFRPLIFRLDAETAHELSVRALAAKAKLWPGGGRGSDPPTLRTRLFGLDFPNPIGLAAGYDKDARVPEAMLGLGFGFVEVGTVTPRPQPGNPRPRLFRLAADEAVINRFGFNSAGAKVVLAALSHRPRGARAGLVAVNVGANRESPDRIEDYVLGYRTFAPVADYVTVNVSSPNTPGLRDLQSAGELGRLLARLREAREHVAAAGHRTPPLLLKIAPDLTEPALAAIVGTAVDHHVDGLVISNTTISRPDLNSPLATETGGLSGRPLFALSTAMLAKAHRLAEGRLPLVGVGGVASGEDAFAKIAAGASLVQLYTALVYQGPGLARRVKRELAAILELEGFASVTDAVGTRAAEMERIADPS
jgi:dihydroorotate dehydrogenase